MKTLFCDDCIREILETVKNQLVAEFVIFDSDRKAFYPIDSGAEVRIGDYCLIIEYEDDYEIIIKISKNKKLPLQRFSNCGGTLMIVFIIKCKSLPEKMRSKVIYSTERWMGKNARKLRLFIPL